MKSAQFAVFWALTWAVSSVAAAGQQDAKATLTRAYDAYYGETAAPDLARAETLLREAQTHGVGSKLCVNWLWGIGFAKDPAFALECFRLAQAHDWVAYLYAEGLGAKADPARAIAYLKSNPKAPAKSELLTTPVDLGVLRQKLEAHTSGSYYSPGPQMPSPCWFLADTTADSLQCMGEEVAAEEERTAIVERRVIARLRAKGVAAAKAGDLMHQAHDAWTRFSQEEASFEGYLVAGGGTLASQLGGSSRLSTQESRTTELGHLLEDHCLSPATPAELAKADRQLNATYATLRKKYATGDFAESYPNTNDHLRDVQRVWIAYRDASATLVEALHTGEPAKAMIAAGVAMRCYLTDDRASELVRVDKDAAETRGDDKK